MTGRRFIAISLMVFLVLHPSLVLELEAADQSSITGKAWTESETRRFAERHADAKDTALIAYFTRDTEAAIQALERFITVIKGGLVPQNPFGVEAMRYDLTLAYARLARLYLRSNRASEADDQIREAIKYSPGTDKDREGILRLVDSIDAKYADCVKRYKGGDSLCN